VVCWYDPVQPGLRTSTFAHAVTVSLIAPTVGFYGSCTVLGAQQ
jgi:hypothetical protein